MSGETEANVSGWTVDTLNSHFSELRKTDLANIEKRFTLAEDAVKQALAAADKASDKADNATEKRFDAVNEFRKTLSDQTATFMPRKEVEALVQSLNEKIDDTRGTRRQGSEAVWGYIIGGLGVLFVLGDLVLRATGH